LTTIIGFLPDFILQLIIQGKAEKISFPKLVKQWLNWITKATFPVRGPKWAVVK